MSQYVQFGCGLSAPVSWRNFDASPTVRLQALPGAGGLFRRTLRPLFPRNVEYGDVVLGLPVARDSCQAVYCSHVLEHLALDDLRSALANAHSYLARGGTFRLVVPDLRHLVEEYMARGDGGAAPEFMRATILGVEKRSRGVGAFLRAWAGNSKHLWMWDFPSLSTELGRAGFSQIRRAQVGDAKDPQFLDVEEQSRWDGCLGIECRKL